MQLLFWYRQPIEYQKTEAFSKLLKTVQKSPPGKSQGLEGVVMLGRNTEMNLLQMNKQKNESACGIPFIFLVYLTEGGSESVAFSVIFL